MLTGKLDRMSRAEAKSLIEQNSGSIISNVSKKLDYLIVGEKPTKRKIEHATSEIDKAIICLCKKKNGLPKSAFAITFEDE